VGGALSREDGRWHPSRAGFYLPVRALSRIVRAKFRDQINTRGLLGQIPGEVWAMEWNVNCQAAGDGIRALQYLAPYVFKVAISERRILSVDAHHVRFRYQKPQRHRVRTMTLPIMEFMRRFLQHVLPRGFMKIRYYGFLSPTSSVSLEDIKARIEMTSGLALRPPRPPASPRRPCAAVTAVALCDAIAWSCPETPRSPRSPRLARGPASPPPSAPCLGVPDPRGAPSASEHRRPFRRQRGAPSPTRSRDPHGAVQPPSARHHAR